MVVSPFIGVAVTKGIGVSLNIERNLSKSLAEVSKTQVLTIDADAWFFSSLGGDAGSLHNTLS